MSDKPLDAAIRAAQKTLEPTSTVPPSDVVLAIDTNHSWWGAFDLPAETETNPTRPHPEGAPPDVSTPDPVWKAIRSLKSLLCLIPLAPNGNTRLGQCVAAIRGSSERDQFPDLGPAPSEPFTIRMINYPRLELNQIIDEARPIILDLLAHIAIEAAMRERLNRELRKAAPFLEHDNRGTIEGVIEPTGPTKEQQRNDARLEALAVFLAEVQQRPDAVLHAAGRIHASARVALDGWYFDVRAGKLRRGDREATDLSPEVVLYMRMVVEAQPDYVPLKLLKDRARDEGIVIASIKPEQIKNQLPAHFLMMLEFKRGCGARLKP